MNLYLHYHKSYRKALRKLDTQAIGQVQQAVMDFEDHPKSPGLNFERLHGTHFCSIRASKELRIILAPLEGESGANWLLVYVDHHDDAYHWAKRKQVSYTPATQTYDILWVKGEEEETQRADAAPGRGAAIWQAWTDAELQEIGVKQVLIPLVRQVSDEAGLRTLDEVVPEVTREALGFALLGEAPSEVIDYVAAGKVPLPPEPTPEQVLASPNSQRNVAQLRRTDELERFYYGDFADWMIYLHHTQRRLADGAFKGAVKVTGGAGTGKTVVALHRAKYLQAHRRDERPIFFTTFNRNLADNLEAPFRQLGLDSKQVQLNNIHRWLLTFAKQYPDLWPDKWWVVELAPKLKPQTHWEQAQQATGIDAFDLDFARAEYQEVVLYHDLTTEAAYLAVSRQGRGQALGEASRRELWSLMQTYQELLAAAGYLHLGQVANTLARHLATHPEQRPFSHVIVDEVQDFGMPELRLVRQLTDEGPNDLFLTGDPLQKIYRTRFRFSQAGISVRGQRSQRLRINYRTSEEIRQAATQVITGVDFDDFDGGVATAEATYSLFRGEVPQYRPYPTLAAELAAVIEALQQQQAQGMDLAEICLAGFHSNNTVKPIIDALHRADIPYYDLRKSKGDQRGVRVSSFHGMKGMEFRAVYLLALGQGQYPHRFRTFDQLSDSEQQAECKAQQALLYVAMSRARDLLWLSGVGEACGWVGLESNLATGA